jgi:hypothetical protein
MDDLDERDIETVAFVERGGSKTFYRFDDADWKGVHTTRIPEAEFGHERTFAWAEVARMVRNLTMRIYGLDQEEVETLTE